MKKLYEHLADTGVQLEHDVGVIVEGYLHPQSWDWGYLAGKVGRVITDVVEDNSLDMQDFDFCRDIILMDAQRRLSQFRRLQNSTLCSFNGGGLVIDGPRTRVSFAQTPLFMQTARDLAVISVRSHHGRFS